MDMETDNPEMISREYLDDVYLNNEVPDEVEVMLYRDNMKLKSPSDVFLWFKGLSFDYQKIMLSSMISVMGHENNTKMTGAKPFTGDTGMSTLSSGEINHNCAGIKSSSKVYDDTVRTTERPLSRLGALSPAILKRVLPEDCIFDNLPNENVTVRKKK